MRLKSHTLALVAVAAGVALPAAADARPLPDGFPTAPDRMPVGQCGKDYSKNAATGDYCPVRASTQPVGAATIESPTAASDEGFSWADASAGAGAMLAVVAVGGGGLLLVRRRHGSGGAQRTPATS